MRGPREELLPDPIQMLSTRAWSQHQMPRVRLSTARCLAMTSPAPPSTSPRPRDCSTITACDGRGQRSAPSPAQNAAHSSAPRRGLTAIGHCPGGAPAPGGRTAHVPRCRRCPRWEAILTGEGALTGASSHCVLLRRLVSMTVLQSSIVRRCAPTVLEPAKSAA